MGNVKWPPKWYLTRRIPQKQGWRVIADYDTREECLAGRDRMTREILLEDLRVLGPNGEDFVGPAFGEETYG